MSLNFTDTATNPNNLGGMGPDFYEPREIRYVRVDGNAPDEGLYDLLAVNTSFYLPNMQPQAGATKGANLNGVYGNFGNFNLASGLDVAISLCFVETGTTTPATLELFYMTFYDFDLGAQPCDRVATTRAPDMTGPWS